MTAEAPPLGELEAIRPYPARTGPKGSLVYKLITTTDHKMIGIMYCVACISFFFIGGLLALLMRTELAAPGLQFLSNEQFNQLFTMHGTIMLLFYATPIVFGFANLVLPLQIGAPDVAFPRLNAFSFWLFVFGATIGAAGFITPGGAADFGWTAYTPLTDAIHSPGAGGDLWIMGLIVAGLGTILGAVNMITTVVCMRAPGMTMFRMPIFTWNIMVTSILILIAFPLLTAALFGLAADRHLGAHIYDAANGGVLLWQHLFLVSSATPRSTSSRCRFSGSSRRSSRCFPASRSSVTPRWFMRRCRSRRCRSRCGRTTCSRPEPYCCPSSLS
ncbi:Putative cytochrome C oxidase polypeptide I CtaD (cytochrome AA3 subunit 1) (part1) [Mycobacterium canettii CIPT 140070010]|nr:Putative cytochrome C oxidase polypeptide I CtaD (cytochrome AA3 subunit 1) (part1) [Mycobacterium canettii CIPT 140070010]